MERIIAGGVVFLSLIILADNPSTEALGVAFAYVILLSTAMAVGPVAFGRISSLVNGNTPATMGAGSGGGVVRKG